MPCRTRVALRQCMYAHTKASGLRQRSLPACPLRAGRCSLKGAFHKLSLASSQAPLVTVAAIGAVLSQLYPSKPQHSHAQLLAALAEDFGSQDEVRIFAEGAGTFHPNPTCCL